MRLIRSYQKKNRWSSGLSEELSPGGLWYVTYSSFSSGGLRLNHISGGGKKGASCLFYFDFKAVICYFPCSYMTYEPSAQGEPPQIEGLVGKLHLVPCKETNLLPLLLSLPRLIKDVRRITSDHSKATTLSLRQESRRTYVSYLRQWQRGGGGG